MLNKEDFSLLCDYLGFPHKAILSLSADFDIIIKNKKCFDCIHQVLTSYTSGNLPQSLYQCQGEFERIAESAGIHSYSSQMIFYIILIPALKNKYIQKGYSISVFDNSLKDFKCKLNECYNVYGIWGSFVASWFSRFFNFTLFGIGRLEFAPYKCEYDYSSAVCSIKAGDPVIDVHIPSSGRLPHDEVMDSYREAYIFFTEKLNFYPKAFVCESWLLFPEHYNIIPNCRNIIDFMKDYTIVGRGEDSGDLWRIFNIPDCSDYSSLPRNTYMQKQYADFLLSGGKPGFGKGIFFIGDEIKI